MKIFTLTCDECGTVVAANELEKQRVSKCPGLGCESVLKFIDLPKTAQEHVLENIERYKS